MTQIEPKTRKKTYTSKYDIEWTSLAKILMQESDIGMLNKLKAILAGSEEISIIRVVVRAYKSVAHDFLDLVGITRQIEPNSLDCFHVRFIFHFQPFSLFIKRFALNKRFKHMD